MQLILSDGTQIPDPYDLINRYYEHDAHILYDNIEVLQDNKLDLIALSSLAFVEVLNPRLDEWRHLWNLRSQIEAILSRIPADIELTSQEIQWSVIADIFEFFFLRVGGFGLARTSKILHKKRPLLIPILDAPVTDHYRHAQDKFFKECPRQGKILGWAAVETILAIRNDIIANKDALIELQKEYINRGINLSLLRTFDIIVREWRKINSQTIAIEV